MEISQVMISVEAFEISTESKKCRKLFSKVYLDYNTITDFHNFILLEKASLESMGLGYTGPLTRRGSKFYRVFGVYSQNLGHLLCLVSVRREGSMFRVLRMS